MTPQRFSILQGIRCWILIIQVFLHIQVSISNDDTAEGTPKTCKGDSTTTCTGRHECGIQGVCGVNWLYDQGGTAQSYKPNAPIRSDVCEKGMENSYSYKPAFWPFLRSSRPPGSAPKIRFRGTLQSCFDSGNDCCCEPYTPRTSPSMIDIWQARPDGTYSSLSATLSEDCRARVVTQTDTFEFSTVAPGSTGIMGGLGPSGWDFSPYGPPTIHMLFTVPGHAPLLIDFPLLPQSKSLEHRDFGWSDWRGVAWVRPSKIEDPFTIHSWVAKPDENLIEIGLHVRLLQSSEVSVVDFCPAPLYGLPNSFFLEPILICAPYMLDFLAL